MKRKILLLTIIAAALAGHIYAFDGGFTLGLKAVFSGSYTDPHINVRRGGINLYFRCKTVF